MGERVFAPIILTHGRPDKVVTYQTLRRSGYSGPIYLMIDNHDSTADKYRDLYGDDVVVFDKDAASKTFDHCDNFNEFRSIVYARNASFDVARDLGLSHFIQLDDDYTSFQYRFTGAMVPAISSRGDSLAMSNLDRVFGLMMDVLDSTPIHTIALAQGGDYLGGVSSSSHNDNGKCARFIRKAMNSFMCRTDRRFFFTGTVNEDVNTYTSAASKGLLMVTTTFASLSQMTTQKNTGGMTDLYLDSGTYVKSFYSVMLQPSSVRVAAMQSKSHPRLHHKVDWRRTVPKILSESHRNAG